MDLSLSLSRSVPSDSVLCSVPATKQLCLQYALLSMYNRQEVLQCPGLKVLGPSLMCLRGCDSAPSLHLA